MNTLLRSTNGSQQTSCHLMYEKPSFHWSINNHDIKSANTVKLHGVLLDENLP